MREIELFKAIIGESLSKFEYVSNDQVTHEQMKFEILRSIDSNLGKNYDIQVDNFIPFGSGFCFTFKSILVNFTTFVTTEGIFFIENKGI